MYTVCIPYRYPICKEKQRKRKVERKEPKERRKEERK